MTHSIQLTALDHHFAEFITALDRSPGPELWLASALASAMAGQGNTCLNLAEHAETSVLPFRQPAEPLSAPLLNDWLATLSACSTVGAPGDYAPLVLDRNGRLYLHRSWEYERRVAESLLSRLDPLPVESAALAAGLDRYFPNRSGSFDWQRAAAMAAATRRLTVITGGPGTGKTTTVARILALLIDQSAGSELTIGLAAPTGKAAMRLRHSILQALDRLEAGDTLRARMPERVQTIHRLLGVLPEGGGFRHNRDNPLACNLLMVDEVSMVDLPLMARLLDALPAESRLILLGDRDQLASVEAGAVLADVCNQGGAALFSTEFRELLQATCGPLPQQPAPETGATIAPSPLGDAVIHLRTSFRFTDTSGIGALSSLINTGEAEAAFELLTSGRFTDLTWRTLPDAGDVEAALAAAVREQFAGYMSAATPGEALAELEHFRILSPHRTGNCGVENLNRLTGHALGLKQSTGQNWCSRMPVMVSGNNYELELFNGDTAVIWDDLSTGRLTAHFPHPEGGLRHLSPLRLPPCVPAFALTVHKSQGSEFDRILLILPEGESDILTRELLYTAVTRARSQVEIWGTEEVFCRAVQQRNRRNSGLRERLWETGLHH